MRDCCLANGTHGCIVQNSLNTFISLWIIVFWISLYILAFILDILRNLETGLNTAIIREGKGDCHKNFLICKLYNTDINI